MNRKVRKMIFFYFIEIMNYGETEKVRRVRNFVFETNINKTHKKLNNHFKNKE
jgi:hypothetical protein